MNTLPLLPYFKNACDYYYSNIWQGGKVEVQPWLRKEFDAGVTVSRSHLVFTNSKKRNWFALRFGESYEL